MYVKNLQIKNFRCFEDAKVSLNYPEQKAQRGVKLPERYQNVNLFIGANGSGKTTVFKALCLSVLAPILPSSGLRLDYYVRRPPGYRGHVRGVDNSLPHLPNCDILSNVIPDGMDVMTGPVPERLIGQAVIQSRGDIELLTTAHNNPAAWQRIYDSDNPSFFLVAYGANRRAANPEGYTERNRSIRYQRVASIFEEYAGLVPFTVGFLELSRNDRLPEALTLLNALLPETVQLTTDVDAEGRPLFNAFGVLSPFTSLSDGYRGFTAWVWDLLVQMSRVMLPGPLGLDFTSLRGVVIVDEIDLFLHPRWQRLLIEELAVQFPHIQFLFSTHSPLVVGMLEPENIRVLTRQGDSVVIEQYQEETSGKTPTEILTSTYFGLPSTRSPHSGTLSEQAEREMEQTPPDGQGENPIKPLEEEQKQWLKHLMAQSREYEKALRKAEKEVPESE